MVVQNPETGNPPNAGLEEKADFDKRQMHEFKGKRTKGLRWISVQVGGSWLHDAALLDGGRWQAVQTSVEAAAIWYWQAVSCVEGPVGNVLRLHDAALCGSLCCTVRGRRWMRHASRQLAELPFSTVCFCLVTVCFCLVSAL